MSVGDDKTDDELYQMVLAADEMSFSAGRDPKQRSLDVPDRVMNQLGYIGYVIHGPSSSQIYKRICAIHRSLYRSSDFAVGGIHGGFFMFRDVFCRIDIPMMFGTVAIKPLELTDLSPNQVRWLESRPPDLDRFIEQFSAVFDFAGGVFGLADYERPPKPALELFYLAGFQLQSAAATSNSAYDFRGAVQSALLGAELALKGGLVASGHAPENLKSEFGHDKEKAAGVLAENYSDFDIKAVKATLQSMPPYVENRYSPSQPSRIETGEIVMGAQFVAGEVMRNIAKFSMKSRLQLTT